MVVHAPGTDKNLSLPEVGKELANVKEFAPPVVATAPPPYSGGSAAVRNRGPRKCCFISSMVMNLLLIGALVTTGIFMCRYKTKYCEMKIQEKVEKFTAIGVSYDVEGCEVYATTDYIDNNGIIPEDDRPWHRDDDIEDELEERFKEWRNKHGRPKYPRPGRRPGYGDKD